MPAPITRSEFLYRLNAAVVLHGANVANINSNEDLVHGRRAIAVWQSAASSARQCKLPAVAQPLNPMVDAIDKICTIDNGLQLSYLEVMALSERAWEYLLNDMDAYILFKELNQ